MFTEKINLKEYPRINEWLTKVETEMKITLAKGAEKSIAQRRAINKVIVSLLFLIPPPPHFPFFFSHTFSPPGGF